VYLSDEEKGIETYFINTQLQTA